ncbi:lipoprotein [Streptomyces yerevanensis]|uniref:lipoprotein n=1 Tax=Streptomyces yerevanensis TaxID=66378 RepID=UPI00052486D6|nr:lipoprotein [Streptomyces yerevanensis]
MKRRPTLLAAITLTAAAALTLSACGGGDSDSSKDNDKIAGADTGDSSTSASPSASPADSVERPEIKLPSDDVLTFTPEETGDPIKDAILRDNAEFIRALDAAIVAQNPRLPALEFYTEGEGAVAANEWVQGYKDAGTTVTGSVRYFDRDVKMKSKNSAVIGYCADESKGYNKVIKTGEIKKTKVTKDSYVAYSAQVTKNKQGVWELMKITSARGAAGCQP